MGAWWLGYLIAGTITLVSAIPFWFLPKSLPVPVDKHDLSCTLEQTRFITDSPSLEHKFRQEEPPNLQQMAKGVLALTGPQLFYSASLRKQSTLVEELSTSGSSRGARGS